MQFNFIQNSLRFTSTHNMYIHVYTCSACNEKQINTCLPHYKTNNQNIHIHCQKTLKDLFYDMITDRNDVSRIYNQEDTEFRNI